MCGPCLVHVCGHVLAVTSRECGRRVGGAPARARARARALEGPRPPYSHPRPRRAPNQPHPAPRGQARRPLVPGGGQAGDLPKDRGPCRNGIRMESLTQN